MTFQSFGSLRTIDLASGTVSLDAAWATLPKLIFLPLGVCVMTPFEALH